MDNARKEILKGLSKGKNLARGQLDKDVLKVKGNQDMANVTEPHMRMNVGTDKIDTKEMANITSGENFGNRMKELDTKQRLKSTFKAAAEAGDTDLMDKLRKIASKVGKASKALPVIGAIAAGFNTQDASAAVPVLGAADNLGPQEGTLEADLESGNMTEDKMKEMARLMALQNRQMRGE